ncbi:ApeI family dehydratase [Massilia glaciei]|uniref:AMP-binding protein n=1 Tax=Massilia glaciei TaxID=1524097 RepID=A0A2U2HE31_9BURK|nr:AMP-binding protein [Massilia glaciei]PWF41549.1 AMP-binding protein [Massilia glaciei]
MSDFFPALAARAPAALVGRRAGGEVRMVQFCARVGAWRALAERCGAADIALFHDDSVEFAAALLGCWQAGRTVWLGADTLPASCAALGASVQAFFGQFPPAQAPRSPAATDVCERPWREPAPDFSALVVHTSGSSGQAQAIPKRFSQLTSEIETLEACFGARLGAAEIVATVSHQHIYGLLFKVLWPLACARPIHAASLNFPEQMALALGRAPCVLVASPAHLKRLPGHLDWAPAAACLRAVFSSGGMLAPEAAFGAGALLGQVPFEVYGSSESGGVAWCQRRPGLVDNWEPLPGVAWRVGASGELEVRSAHAGGDAWLQLADRVQASGGGFLLRGRSDRIVKIEEKRVSLDAVEAAIAGTGLAREARVIVAPAAAGARQSLAAFVVPTAAGAALLAGGGKAALNQRLRQLLAGALEAVALPRRWRYLDQLPLNAQGKTTHAQLLALLGGVSDARPRLPQVRLLERADARVLLELSAPAQLVYFEGHFEAAPVLPGVVQLDWAIFYGRRHFALGPQFRAVHALKFQHLIRPETTVWLELNHDAARDSLNFRYFSDAGQHSGGRILFGQMEASP